MNSGRDRATNEHILAVARGSFAEALTLMVNEHAKWCDFCKGHIIEKYCLAFREDYRELQRVSETAGIVIAVVSTYKPEGRE